MTLVLAVSLTLLLAILALFEYFEYNTVLDTAEDPLTVQRLGRILPIVNSMDPAAAGKYIHRISHCHDSYTISATAYPGLRSTNETAQLAASIGPILSIAQEDIRVGYATLERDDFAFADCSADEMRFPIDGIVVSAALESGRWLNAEVHPHEWHLTPSMQDWLIRSVIAFVLVGAVAFFFVRRLSQPLRALADSATAFAAGLEARLLDESGPEEVRRTVHAFNVMQRQVVDEMKRRTATLAAISHDIRSPLTALRLKAEMIEDDVLRGEHIASIDRLERVTASALAYLKGEARDESKRTVDLSELIESECADIQDMGGDVTFRRPPKIEYACRADALAGAIRNLIDNAVKYAGAAEVRITTSPSAVDISVADSGPGIPADHIARSLQPFEQLSASYDDPAGGFGLGLAIAKAVVEGHDGELRLTANRPNGLIATLRLPLPRS